MRLYEYIITHDLISNNGNAITLPTLSKGIEYTVTIISDGRTVTRIKLRKHQTTTIILL